MTVRQRLGSTSYGSRMSQLETRFAANSRKASYVSHQSRYSPHAIDLPRFRIQDKKCEPTHFHFATSAKHRAAQRALEPRNKKIEVILCDLCVDLFALVMKMVTQLLFIIVIVISRFLRHQKAKLWEPTCSQVLSPNKIDSQVRSKIQEGQTGLLYM